MKSILKKIFSVILAAAAVISAVPVFASAASVSFDRIVNASTHIIITNEGNYSTVVRNDNGALSIGQIGWHATNALNLLKDIVAENPTQALNILGATLYNEIITSVNWENRIATTAEASLLKILLSTSESKKVQDETAYEYISSYVRHGQSLGITEPESLVFFADYQNQNGYTGAENFFYQVKASYGTINLLTLYNGSSKNTRRTRTYNFCAEINWNNFTGGASGSSDTQAPEISNVVVDNITSEGYRVSCSVSDNTSVIAVFFAVYYKADGVEGVKWYQQTPSSGKASHTVKISEFSNRFGEYCTYIYAFDSAGNYAYAELNAINVKQEQPQEKLSLTITSQVSRGEKGDVIKWSAAASGGSGNYVYAFSLYRDNTLIERRNYVDYSDFTYTADTTGSYTVMVSVVDSANSALASAASTPVNIFEPIVIDSFGPNKTAAIFGEMILWTVSASGGEGALSYSYTVYCDDEIIYSSDYSDDYRFAFKPPKEGVYTATVYVRDERSQTKSVKSDSVTVIRPLSAGNVEFSKDYAVAGMSVICSAEVIGGSGSYTCVFSIFCDGELVLKSNPVKSNSYTFTVPKEGKYTASVTVTDEDTSETSAAGGSMTADAKPMTGDANLDGKITAGDARIALRYSAKLEKPQEGFESASDANNDGKITAADARLILRVAAKLQNF